MSELKLTKTHLRLEQVKLERLRKYLPTLQLKKALLQIEVNLAQLEVQRLVAEFGIAEGRVAKYAPLLTEPRATDLFAAVAIENVECTHENVAGVDVPLFERIVFKPATYALFDTPVWFESAILGLKQLIGLREQVGIAEKKKKALEKELRDVSVRVNLFEKILIPRSLANIKKIKIFLGDQQLAAVSQAKVAKKKILLRSKSKFR